MTKASKELCATFTPSDKTDRKISASRVAAIKFSALQEFARTRAVHAEAPNFFKYSSRNRTPVSSSETSAKVVEPLPDISAPPMAPGIYLQLGAFAERRNAESFRDYANSELGKLNENIYLLSEPQRYRLQLGPFASEEAARKMAHTIATRLKFKPFMVRL